MVEDESGEGGGGLMLRKVAGVCGSSWCSWSESGCGESGFMVGGGVSLDLSAVIVCCLTDVVVEEGYSLLFEDEAQSCKHEVEVQRVCWALWRGLWVVFYVDACCVAGF